MQTPDDTNAVFKTAGEFINNTSCPVFLTGKAGTGKTTFLKYIRENTHKNTAIVAPTGVAAINAGGTTIHSFFQLPFGPYLPLNKSTPDAVDKHSILSQTRLGSERKELMQQLELLIIDEISMVRCDVLDAIDFILRYVRNQLSRPFGGVQVLYIGDMYQLPPVIKQEEWNILSNCYANPFFFCSQVVINNPPVYIELQKVYRQQDQEFIDLLNQVRNNKLLDGGYALLQRRYNPQYLPGDNKKIIILTTHNNKADTINNSSLLSLNEPLHSFEASIEGDFTEKIFPADKILQIKKGAQVMFIKNDTEKVRRYFNGKIGTVVKIETDKVWVNIDPGNIENTIPVKKERWENIQYNLDKKNNRVEENVIGSFSQYPLRLAWAITIHKSQGLTFEDVVIDAEKAFAPGQVYVALSRCTSLDGIILKSQVSRESMRSDERIIEFSKNQLNEIQQAEILKKAAREFQCDTISGLLDFKKQEKAIDDLAKWLQGHPLLGTEINFWFADLKSRIITCRKYGERFQHELSQYFSMDIMPEENETMQSRLANGSTWFYNELCTLKKKLLECPAVTDNRQLARDFNKRLESVFSDISFRIHMLGCIKNRFNMSVIQIHKRNYTKDIFKIDSYSGAKDFTDLKMIHPELYLALKDKRNELSERYHAPVYMICSFKGIQEMVVHLPQNLSELALINGFGPARIKKFGNEFIEIIKNYCETYSLEGNIVSLEPKPVRKRSTSKKDTKKITFDLLRDGKKLADISKERNLTIGTIQEHLVPYIESGEIKIAELLSMATQAQIQKAISQYGNQSLQKLKDSLPDVSYAEIKWFLASEKFQLNLVK